tara:strand:+ start:1489 stop:1977 length:489 start_codon:yes stop_codon:yes gene_type:complete
MSKILDLKERSTRRKINRYLNNKVVGHILINEEDGMINIDNFTITRSGDYYQVFDMGKRKFKFNYRKSALIYCMSSRLMELADARQEIIMYRRNINEIITLDPRLAKVKEELSLYQQLYAQSVEASDEFKEELYAIRISDVESKVNTMERAYSKLIDSTNFE